MLLFVCFYCRGLFCFNDTAATEIYTYLHTLSLHDALPSYRSARRERERPAPARARWRRAARSRFRSGQTPRRTVRQGQGWRRSATVASYRVSAILDGWNVTGWSRNRESPVRSEERRVGKACVSKGMSRWYAEL